MKIYKKRQFSFELRWCSSVCLIYRFFDFEFANKINNFSSSSRKWREIMCVRRWTRKLKINTVKKNTFLSLWCEEKVNLGEVNSSQFADFSLNRRFFLVETELKKSFKEFYQKGQRKWSFDNGKFSCALFIFQHYFNVSNSHQIPSKNRCMNNT
jgi:hypothetical protein